MHPRTLVWLTLVFVATACGAKQTTESTVPPPDTGESPLIAACASGTVNSCLVAGNDAEQAGDLGEAARLYGQACELGESSGCALAGGTLAEQGDLAAAATRFAAGCELGDATSCYGHGLVAAGGFGGEPDYSAAVAPLEKACTLGLAAGCGELANLLAQGKGVDVDLDRAATLRDQACDKGDGASCTRLGLEVWRTKDVAGARALFERGCGTELPDPNGCAYFGWLLWSDPTAPDEAKGVAMLDAACSAQSAVGCGLRANVHARLGELDAGKAMLAKACALDAESCASMNEQFEAAKSAPSR